LSDIDVTNVAAGGDLQISKNRKIDFENVSPRCSAA
jgi:hypothetical protein